MFDEVGLDNVIGDDDEEAIDVTFNVAPVVSLLLLL